MKPHILDKLKQIVQSDLSEISMNVIWRNDDNSYDVFGIFQVIPGDPVLVKYQQSTVAEFSCIRHALSWCIAKKYNVYELFTSLQRLDQDVMRLSNDVKVYSSLANKAKDKDKKFVAISKLENTKSRIRGLQHHLDKCVSRAKYCQIRGFNNEIARTRRIASNRTSRPSFGKPNG